MPSAQDCAERLREQAYRTLLPQVRDLEQELKGVSSSLLAGFEQIERKIESLSRIELPASELVLNEILESVVRQNEADASALVLFMQGLRRKETQEEILSFLLDGIHRFYPRVALFAVRGGRFIGWSSRGFAEAPARNIGACSFSCSEYPQFEAALDGEEPVAISEFAEDSPLQFLREDGTEPWRVLPLKTMQRPVALLLTGGTSNRSDAAALMTGFAAFRLENVALKILYDMSAERPVSAPQTGIETAPPPVPSAGPTPYPAAAAEEPAFPQAPMEASLPESEPLYSLEAAGPESVEEQPLQEPVPETAGFAMKEVEEPPDAEAPAEEAPAPVPLPEASIALQPEVKPVPEEERLHSDAKRFARLLVQEIKLYNEHHVKEGRVNSDLYLRLKREIDRSRDMYEGRISSVVSRRIDYFHDEIIRILGDNDPSTLGSDYPGPRVES